MSRPNMIQGYTAGSSAPSLSFIPPSLTPYIGDNPYLPSSPYEIHSLPAGSFSPPLTPALPSNKWAQFSVLDLIKPLAEYMKYVSTKKATRRMAKRARETGMKAIEERASSRGLGYGPGIAGIQGDLAARIGEQEIAQIGAARRGMVAPMTEAVLAPFARAEQFNRKQEATRLEDERRKKAFGIRFNDAMDQAIYWETIGDPRGKPFRAGLDAIRAKYGKLRIEEIKAAGAMERARLSADTKLDIAKRNIQQREAINAAKKAIDSSKDAIEFTEFILKPRFTPSNSPFSGNIPTPEPLQTTLIMLFANKDNLINRFGKEGSADITENIFKALYEKYKDDYASFDDFVKKEIDPLIKAYGG